MAASEAAKKALFLTRFLNELGHGSSKPVELGMDNQAAIAISYNPELYRVLRGHSLRRGPPPPLPRQARLGQETRPRRHQVQLVPPARIPLAPPRSDQHGGGLH